MYTYVLLLNANKQSFIDNLPPSDRGQLIEYIKKIDPSDCLCCPCFAWEFGEDGKINGCRCTLGGEPNTKEKGDCKMGQKIEVKHTETGKNIEIKYTCDRCGKEIEETKPVWCIKNIYRIHAFKWWFIGPVRDYKKHYVCSNCFRSFKKWYGGKDQFFTEGEEHVIDRLGYSDLLDGAGRDPGDKPNQ